MLKKYILYALRWQLSTPIMAPIIGYCTGLDWPVLAATALANLIGSAIFFWVDKYIFRPTIKYPLWEVQDHADCFDCDKKNCRCYRLVKAQNYDRLDDKQPEFRCESCSQRRTQELIESGVIMK